MYRISSESIGKMSIRAFASALVSQCLSVKISTDFVLQFLHLFFNLGKKEIKVIASHNHNEYQSK